MKCAKRLGSRLAEELAIPIYLYGFAAGAEYRRAVPQIRAGEYEGIEKKARIHLKLNKYMLNCLNCKISSL